ncbi:AzlD domain-containing protein [Pelagicoccus mobilis]|uniref:AzlD domain-containing protein n=1 Tax=Pelagicoccus mobilis TaxID=415221 RepID=A0A934VP54_9BACT|nr:AzlD domain-containing protein [Pelagicoccus mobilis]
MIEEQEYWLVAIAVGVGTFLVRASFLLLPIRVGGEGRLESVLRFIPPAALTALIVPAVLLSGASEGEMFEVEKPVAALVAVLVAWKTRNVLATIALGMLTYWGLSYVL